MNNYKNFSYDEPEKSIEATDKKQSKKTAPKKSAKKSAPSLDADNKIKSDAAPEKKQNAKAKKTSNDGFEPNYVRMTLGIFVGLFIMLVPIVLWAFGYILYSRAPIGDGGRWLEIILMVLLYILAAVFMFYSYGWMHWSFIAYTEHVNGFVRVFGKIAGGIGYVFRPFVLMVYGANKKWLYAIFVGVTCLVGGTVFLLDYLNVLVFDATLDFGSVTMKLSEFSLPITIVCYLNAFLALTAKRCKKCGCMMTDIEAAIMGEAWNNSGNYIDSSLPSSSLVVGKFYVCDNCGSVKKGIGFDVQTR